MSLVSEKLKWFQSVWGNAVEIGTTKIEVHRLDAMHKRAVQNGEYFEDLAKNDIEPLAFPAAFERAGAQDLLVAKDGQGEEITRYLDNIGKRRAYVLGEDSGLQGGPFDGIVRE